ncbi:hypothetical protein JHK85_044058 [Glycine max]|nr:hypothetical protein JHK85_044058 [Glycine max]
MPDLLETVDFKDTFVDADHLKESFLDYEVSFVNPDGSRNLNPRPPFKIKLPWTLKPNNGALTGHAISTSGATNEINVIHTPLGSRQHKSNKTTMHGKETHTHGYPSEPVLTLTGNTQVDRVRVQRLPDFFNRGNSESWNERWKLRLRELRGMMEEVPGIEEADEPPASSQSPVDVPHNMFVYDGGKTLYTVGPLPLNKYEFNVLLEKSFTKRSSAESPGANGSLHEESKRSKRSFLSKTFMVEINFATKIPLLSIVNSLKEV